MTLKISCYYCIFALVLAWALSADSAFAQTEEQPFGAAEPLPEKLPELESMQSIEGMDRDNYRLQRSNIDRERLDGSAIDYERLQRSNSPNFRSFGRID